MIRRREFNSLHLLRSFCAKLGVRVDDATLLELAWLWYSPITAHSSKDQELLNVLSGLGYTAAEAAEALRVRPEHLT